LGRIIPVDSSFKSSVFQLMARVFIDIDIKEGLVENLDIGGRDSLDATNMDTLLPTAPCISLSKCGGKRDVKKSISVNIKDGNDRDSEEMAKF
jgi:hypothetical protein